MQRQAASWGNPSVLGGKLASVCAHLFLYVHIFGNGSGEWHLFDKILGFGASDGCLSSQPLTFIPCSLFWTLSMHLSRASKGPVQDENNGKTGQAKVRHLEECGTKC